MDVCKYFKKQEIFFYRKILQKSDVNSCSFSGYTEQNTKQSKSPQEPLGVKQCVDK